MHRMTSAASSESATRIARGWPQSKPLTKGVVENPSVDQTLANLSLKDWLDEISRWRCQMQSVSQKYAIAGKRRFPLPFFGVDVNFPAYPREKSSRFIHQ